MSHEQQVMAGEVVSCPAVPRASGDTCLMELLYVCGSCGAFRRQQEKASNINEAITTRLRTPTPCTHVLLPSTHSGITAHLHMCHPQADIHS